MLIIEKYLVEKTPGGWIYGTHSVQVFGLSEKLKLEKGFLRSIWSVLSKGTGKGHSLKFIFSQKWEIDYEW